MAKSPTAGQRHELRQALGLSTEAVAFDVQAAKPRLGPGNQEINQQVADEESREKPSLWEITKASAQVDNTGIRYATRPDNDFLIDPEFNGKEYWKTQKSRLDAMPGIDVQEVMRDVATAASAEEADHWLSLHEKDYANEQLLMDAGMKALLPRMAVSILDPVDLSISALVAPLGAATKVGKVGKIATAAFTAAAASGGTEAVLASNNAMRDELDIGFAIAAGFGLGGGLATIFTRGSKEARLVDQIRNDLAAGNVDAAAARLTGDSAGAARRVSESLKPDRRLAGAAYDNVNEALGDIEAPTFSFKGLNNLFRTMHSKILFSDSEIVRKAGARLLEGGYLKDRSKVRGFTAEGRANVIRRTFETGVFRDSLPMFKKWAERMEVGSLRRAVGSKAGEDFYSQVGRALRGEVASDIAPEATEAAQALRKHLDSMYELAERAGVKGFTKEALEDYFPRMIDTEKFWKIRREFGEDGLIDWFARAIDNASDDLEPELAVKIARAYVHTMSKKARGLETDLVSGIRLDDVEHLQQIFEGYDGLDELLAEIENIKLKENAQRGGVSFGKRRIRFDESFDGPIKSLKTGEVRPLKFHEIYENDARKVLKRYGHIMSGHIGVAQELGIKSRKEWEEFENAITDDHAARNTDSDTAKAEIRALREAYNLLVGANTIDPNPTGDLSKLARTFTGYTYATRGGQFGINALAEAANIIGTAGVRAFLRSIPEWRSMMKRAADGTLEHDLARTLEVMFAPGINNLTGVAIRNMDELGETVGGTSVIGRASKAFDNPLRVAGRATSMVSGLNLVTDLTQRIAAVELIRKFARFAGGKKISKGQLERLRNMGLTESMQERVFEQIRQAGVFRNGRLVDLDVEKWADSEALDAMNLALNREMRSVIQENDIGTVTRYFHHPVGRVLMQFMRFPMEAVQKQLARSLHFHDAEAAKSLISGLFITSTVYMAQTAIEYANNPEERKKRLDPVNVAKVAFMRTGVSSMVPAAVDTVLPLMGSASWGEDVPGINPDGRAFSYGRSSGFTSGIMGNPVFSAVDTGQRLTRNVSAALLSDERQISQQDVRDFASLLPGYRVLGLSNAVNAIAQQFPEDRKE